MEPVAEPVTPGDLPVPPVQPEEPMAGNSRSPGNGGVISTEGQLALKRFFHSSRSLTRHVPARYLNHQPKSDAYRRFRAALLVSDILEPSLERYLQKVEHCLPMTDADRALVLQDAERDYRLATDFQADVSSAGRRSHFTEFAAHRSAHHERIEK
jgi:hypothetical protein